MRFIVVALLLLTFGFTVAAQDPPPAKADNVNSWQEFTSKEGEFSVLLPGTPIQQDRTLQTGIGAVAVRDFFLQSDISAYYLSYAQFPNVGPLTPQDYKEMLDTSRDRVLADGSKVISESEVLVAGNAGREVIAQKQAMIIRARFFFANGKLYNVILGVQPKTAFRDAKPSPNAADRTDLFEAISKKFFDSFRLTK